MFLGSGGFRLAFLEGTPERFAFARFAVVAEIGEELRFFYSDMFVVAGHFLNASLTFSPACLRSPFL